MRAVDERGVDGGGVELAERRWPDVATGAGGAGVLVAVPVGACEQHGPHLPLGTDTLVANALARALAARRPDVVVAPALAITSSGEHAGFPGTLSIGRTVMEALVVELVRSADWSRGVVLVNGHGGNRSAVDAPSPRCVGRAAGRSRGGRTFPAAIRTPGTPRRRSCWPCRLAPCTPTPRSPDRCRRSTSSSGMAWRRSAHRVCSAIPAARRPSTGASSSAV
jgi:hypothetical protein